MREPAEELTQRFAKIANGYQRYEVMWAGGVMILNALRQSHKLLPEAERELDDLINRLRTALRENHYNSNGERRMTNIVVPSLDELIATELRH
jgi:hypothetical protein